ncbi:MAG: hypothetical protein ACU843_16465 [Gammaproteobacteria bacterium]
MNEAMLSSNPRSVRQAFLLGMTLNELAFLLFFLLVLISARLLEVKNQEIAEKSEQLRQLQAQFGQEQRRLEENFKKLGLIQFQESRLQELQPRLHPGELDEPFKRLVESETRLRNENESLRNVIDQITNLLQSHTQSRGTMGSPSPVAALGELLEYQDRIETQNLELESRIKSLDDRNFGSGLDHRPCWSDAQSGKIEYLYRITILENQLKIEAAWPPDRSAEVENTRALGALANRTVSPTEFSRIATPILDWSRRQNPECRHFVQILDHESTSKNAFKKQLRLIETFFYKYLEPEDS